MRLMTLLFAALLSTQSLLANNFRAADMIYVPTTGRISTFNTDVYLSNPNAERVSVSVAFAPSDTSDNSGVIAQARTLAVLQPFERREIRDPLKQIFGLEGGFGQMIFFGCSESNPTCDCAADDHQCRNISVESRIYSSGSNCAAGAASCTTGQLFSGLPWFQFAGSGSPSGYEKVFIAGLRHFGTRSAPASGFRSNIGLTNASQFSSTVLSVELFDGVANSLGRTTVTLGPLGHTQRNLDGLFQNLGPIDGAAFVVVAQESVTPTAGAAEAGCADGCPGFFAYGSVLDNVTNDATTLNAQFFGGLTGTQLGCIFGAKAPARPVRRH